MSHRQRGLFFDVFHDGSKRIRRQRIEKNNSFHAAEIFVAAAAFMLPTLVMGAVFCHLAQAAKNHRYGLGTALAVNSMGCTLAPFLFGILLVALWGAAERSLPLASVIWHCYCQARVG